MKIEELPSEPLQANHTCVSLPSPDNSSREALRDANIGLHVDVPSRRGIESPERLLAMEEAPLRPSPNDRVITLTFGAAPR
ncbi:MAG: hypothetical protein EXR69_15055 [Myxococcales bacterium]|nr:hypothetical protein [Myxococcales bacterium]